MVDDRTIREYRLFLRRAREREEVWGLKSAQGWLSLLSPSVAGRKSMPFWSTREAAAEVASVRCPDYQPTSISLDDFKHTWIRYLLAGDALAALDWPPEETGIEAEALMLHADFIGGLPIAVTDVTAEEAHRQFIKRVSEERVLWGLRSQEGWMACHHHPSEDVYLFWSDERNAATFAAAEAPDYAPAPVELFEFLAHWIPGLIRERYRVGTNWMPRHPGLKIGPQELQEQLTGGRVMFDLFLSYASQDGNDVAHPLYLALRRLGLVTWIDFVDIPFITRPDDEAVEPSVAAAIRQCRAFVPILSPHYLDKAWPRTELHLFSARAVDEPDLALLFPVWHNLAASLLESLGELARSIILAAPATFASTQPVSEIARVIAATVNPAHRLRVRDYEGVTRIDIDTDSGLILIRNGSPVRKLRLTDLDLPSVEYFEFSGRFLDDIVFKMNALQIGQDTLSHQEHGESPFFNFTGPIRYVQVNRRMCSQEEIDKGVFINVPGTRGDYPMRPFFASDGVSVGVMTAEAQHELSRLLSTHTAGGGKWRKISLAGEIEMYVADRVFIFDEL